jgi:hypothetical protein
VDSRHERGATALGAVLISTKEDEDDKNYVEILPVLRPPTLFKVVRPAGLEPAALRFEA